MIRFVDSLTLVEILFIEKNWGDRIPVTRLQSCRVVCRSRLDIATGRSPTCLAPQELQHLAAFDVGRVAGRRAGGVGGVLVQAFGKLSDLLLEGLQPLLVLLDEGQDRRLGGRR